MVKLILSYKSIYEKEGVRNNKKSEYMSSWYKLFFPLRTVQSAAQVGLTHIGSY